MKRLLPGVTAIALAALCGNATGPFDKRLSNDQKITHALNRLTFGLRPGDVEEVRRVGLNAWIEQQLHPERVPENPALEAKLKPLETLHMDLADVVRQYKPDSGSMMTMTAGQFVRMNDVLSAEERRKVYTGTAEERTAVLKAMDPDKRAKVLSELPPNVLEYTPEYKEEGEKAQKKRQAERQKENRQNNPRLPDLLNSDQLQVARTGSKEEFLALFESLDADKRPVVAYRLPPDRQAMVPAYRREGHLRQTPRLVVSEDLKEAKIFRAVYSNHQLEEVLVDFWFNHFNVDSTKNVPQAPNLGHVLIGSYERDAIRPHVLGHFKDLLLATARHPAMLYYLDNWESVAPSSFDVGPFAPIRGTVNGVPNSIIPNGFQRMAHGLNENYGREVMELHTLGVKGGYTQADVIAVARCFTGWTVRSADDPKFLFAAFMHDFGEKTVLGHKIAAGAGEQDGLAAIDILARHPSTAKFISMKLARHFVADDPPQALVDRMAQTFTKTDGDLRAVLETMFKSPEFFSEGSWERKIKSPLEMMVSTIRSSGGDVTDAYALVQNVAEMGEPLYSKLDPNGYSDSGEAWMSTAGLMARMNFPAALANGKVPGVALDCSRWKGMGGPAMARALLGRDASSQTLQAIEMGLQGKDVEPSVVASLILSSPDFERK